VASSLERPKVRLGGPLFSTPPVASVERRPEASSAGVEGNARLTGAAGVLLLVLLFVEGLTILRVRELISVHVFVGVLLIPPALLKVATTSFRFARYYSGHPAYRRKGPPVPWLRLIGPLVVLSTFAVLGTGVGLLFRTPGTGGLLLGLHKATFVIWFGLTTLHVLGHLRETAVLAWRDWRPTPATLRGVQGPARRMRRARRAALAGSLLVGVALAALALPAGKAWTTGRTLDRHVSHESAGTATPTQDR
jgi:hypothetical protein